MSLGAHRMCPDVPDLTAFDQALGKLDQSDRALTAPTGDPSTMWMSGVFRAPHCWHRRISPRCWHGAPRAASLPPRPWAGFELSAVAPPVAGSHGLLCLVQAWGADACARSLPHTSPGCGVILVLPRVPNGHAGAVRADSEGPAERPGHRAGRRFTARRAVRMADTGTCIV